MTVVVDHRGGKVSVLLSVVILCNCWSVSPPPNHEMKMQAAIYGTTLTKAFARGYECCHLSLPSKQGESRGETPDTGAGCPLGR